jgi:hypothetical protein
VWRRAVAPQSVMDLIRLRRFSSYQSHCTACLLPIAEGSRFRRFGNPAGICRGREGRDAMTAWKSKQCALGPWRSRWCRLACVTKTKMKAMNYGNPWCGGGNRKEHIIHCIYWNICKLANVLTTLLPSISRAWRAGLLQVAFSDRFPVLSGVLVEAVDRSISGGYCILSIKFDYFDI